MWDQTPPPPTPHISPPPSSSPSENNMKRQTDPYVKASKQKKKTKIYIYLNKLPYISVWKQTFFRGWKENENKTKSLYK